MVDDILTLGTVSSLLGVPPEWEEILHPWGSAFSANPDLPLLRTWDRVSGSQPAENGRMLSRLPRERLDTSSARKTSLATHADHGIWEPTPFISFTQSPQELQKMVGFRQRRKRGSQTITVVNANVRTREGFPILNMDAEMRYYGVPDPYSRSNEYYKNHYICLWEVTEKEAVGNWEWDDLIRTDDWYERIILPAFKGHNDRYNARSEAFAMSALKNALFETQESFISFSRDSCSCSETEEYGACSEDESDSSDKVEENNAMDDALKILEEA
ncbi:hypothetical protein BJX99DRAFT_263084 [Aspergillus californicus]